MDVHVQANQYLANKVMSFIQAHGQSDTMESAGTECKTDAKVIANGRVITLR